ncbi:MAG TPA: sulfur carrier protein ThiS [Solirubrobacteraceae bacterium]|nr:sulfur carrier protein ThiS [Solirubrobacteraceae bacterium]
MSLTVHVNGEPRELGDGTTVAALVAQTGPDRPRGVAVAVDAEVVPRGEWDARELRDGERVEILTAVQGG